MPYIYELMSYVDRENVKAIQLPKYTIFSEWNPTEWIINKDENIYLVYITCTDGTHAPRDFVETITFLLNWKGNHIVVRMADNFKGSNRTYTILEMINFRELDVKIDEIANILREALIIFKRGPVEIYF